MMWLWFIVGQVVNVLRQAKLVAGCAAEKNPINTVGRWIYRNFIGLLVREVIAVGVWTVLVHPKLGPAALSYLMGAQWGQYANVLSEVPVLALPFGIVWSIFADMWLETSPRIKAHIPALGE